MTRSTSGILALVVGPSGAGKDALISAAKQELGSDPSFLFARRVTTRSQHDPTEDQDIVSAVDFAAMDTAGQFLISWKAHGLSYAVPASVSPALKAGRIVVVNVSRTVLARAEQIANTHVVLVTAPPDVLAQRIVNRGREDQEARHQRGLRIVTLPPLRNDLIEISNAGRLEDAATAFIMRLLRLKTLEHPAPTL
jgi:phosphonate metabolism protein PhnN/1,5-bisphosphokinase (PRPP-forming)